jgi:hypothetical protein
VFKEIVIFGESVYSWALPMRCVKSSVRLAGLIDINFAILLNKRCLNFSLAFGANAFCFYYNKPPIVVDKASRIKEMGSRIMDIVIKRSYFRTFATVELKVTRRIEE